MMVLPLKIFCSRNKTSLPQGRTEIRGQLLTPPLQIVPKIVLSKIATNYKWMLWLVTTPTSPPSPPPRKKQKQKNEQEWLFCLSKQWAKYACFYFFLQFSFPSFRVLMKNRIEKHFSGLLKIRTTKTIGTKIMF